VHNSSRPISHHLTFSCETSVNSCALVAGDIAVERSIGQRELQTKLNERIFIYLYYFEQSGFGVRDRDRAQVSECRNIGQDLR
jgi:hypothetical protein